MTSTLRDEIAQKAAHWFVCALDERELEQLLDRATCPDDEAAAWSAFEALISAFKEKAGDQAAALTSAKEVLEAKALTSKSHDFGLKLASRVLAGAYEHCHATL